MFAKRTGSCAKHAGPFAVGGWRDMTAGIVGTAGMNAIRFEADLGETNCKGIRARPLFPYPQVAKYNGSGSTDEGKNFRSKD